MSLTEHHLLVKFLTLDIPQDLDVILVYQPVHTHIESADGKNVSRDRCVHYKRESSKWPWTMRSVLDP